ncbi:MAG: VanW family protein, partial [Candidatus Spyradocola sp.]
SAPQGMPQRPTGARPQPRTDAPRPRQPQSQPQGTTQRPPERRTAPHQAAPQQAIPAYRAGSPRPGQPQRRAERIDPSQRDPERVNWQAKQAARKRKRRVQQVILLVAAVVLVLAGFSIKLAVDLGGGANTFYEGVSVDGLKLNGYTMEEAKQKLEVLNAERIAAMAVKLSYAGREWTISPEQMGVALDIDEKLEQAWALGREGNIFARQKEIKQLKKEGAELTTVLSYDLDMVRGRLSEVKEAVDVPAVDATVTFDPSKEEKFKITQESNGRSVDLDTLLKQVKTQLDNSYTTPIEIKPDVVAPTMLAENLEKATKRISRTTTELGHSSDARIHNIKTALSFFNGMVVQPGQEISFNQVTGPRGLEQGYQNAGVIQDDEIIDGPGGGVCQVSTTLYQAVVKANLEIIRSNKHSLPVSYVDAGTDAAVAYDYKDLIFKNNTDYPIFIEGRVSGSTVVVSIYGYPLEEGTTVEIVTDVYEKIAPAETKVILDTAGEFVTYTDETKVKKKARDGIKVKSFRVVKVNGEEVSRELLRDDYYKEVQGEVYQGVTPREGASNIPEEGSGD